MLALCCGAVFLSCGDGVVDPPPGVAALTGTVTDAQGGTYPDVVVRLAAGAGQTETTTGGAGSYRFEAPPEGALSLSLDLPRAARAVTPLPVAVAIAAGQTARQDFVIAPRPVVPHLNLGAIDFLGEVRDQAGAPPLNPSDALYARNVFDSPFGLLTAIVRPDGTAVLLSDWEAASGEVVIRCQGRTAHVAVDLDGLISGGTYTLWLNFLNVVREPGERVDFGRDVVRIEPLGSGTANVVVADGQGGISTSIPHASCVLTQEVALVMAVVYHISGRTYGTAHIPDPEEVTQLLAYVR